MKESLNMDNFKNTYMDELIRENARLTIQHEADRMELDACKERIAQLEAAGGSADAALDACAKARERARYAEAKLSKAIADLHFVMAGGDPCKVCTVKCSFGEGNCKPVWRGEEAGQ